MHKCKFQESFHKKIIVKLFFGPFLKNNVTSLLKLWADSCNSILFVLPCGNLAVDMFL